MFTCAGPRAGPTGGAGLACPPVICNFNLRATRRPRPLPMKILSLELRYLVERELHGRLAPEDRDEHFQPRLIHVDIRDRTREVRERSPNNLDRLPDLVIHRRLDLLARLDLAWMQEPLHLGPAESERLLPGAHDLSDSRRLAYELPGRVVHVHVHEDVAGELALDRGDFLAVLDLDDALGRDADLTEVPLEAHGIYPALQRRAHLVLVTRVCIYDVPLLQNETLLIPNRKIYKKTRRTRLWNTTSTAATYSARTITMMSTTAVLCLSWSRSGQLTRLSSPLTSLENLLGPARKPPPLLCDCFCCPRFLPIVSFTSQSRAGGTRTHDLRFWRPLLFQLSYCPLLAGPTGSPGAPCDGGTTGNTSVAGCDPECSAGSSCCGSSGACTRRKLALPIVAQLTSESQGRRKPPPAP